MTTKTTTTRSNSKPERLRNEKRQAYKKQRSKEHHEKMGLPWFEDVDDWRAWKARNNYDTKKMRGSAGYSHYKHLMEEKEAEPVPEESEKKHMIDLCMDYEEPEDTNDYIQVIEGIKQCTLCGKQATTGHLESTEHHKRREEHSMATMMVGPAKTTRRFCGDKCTGCPTKSLIQTFWGDAVTHLPLYAMRAHREKGVIHYGKKKRSFQKR